jgi:hypothetical protein
VPELLAVDYAWTHPNPAAIRAAGYVAVLRYLSPDASKNLTGAERDAVWAAGLAVGLVWESSATRALSGAPGGAADARAANDQADALGVPATVPIYYADDTQSTADQVRPYYQGAGSVGRRPVGGYGDIDVVDPLLAEGIITVGWQTAAWSAGRVSSIAHLYQRVTPTRPSVGPASSYDENVILRPDWGAWTPATSTVIPPSLAEAHMILNKPACAIVLRPAADGYWIVAEDGGVFAFGAAPALEPQVEDPPGSGHVVPLAAHHLNGPIIGAACTPSGNGLLLCGADGGVFPAGDAPMLGSVPGLPG